MTTEWWTFNTVDGEVAISTLIAMFLGAAIGFEREQAAKPAGLRTHALVSGASCLLVSLGFMLTHEFSETLPPGVLRADPLGVIEAVVTGVSFLGAGTIIRGQNHHVEGLTTAAAVLFSAAVGMTVAAARVPLAVLLTILVVAALRVPAHWGKPK